MAEDVRSSILQMAKGAIQERVDYEVSRVIDNILDMNTEPTVKRKVDAAANLLEAQGERIADLENELQAERHGCDQRPEFERVYMGRWNCGKEGNDA